ncbi:MAG: hypothetical protein A3J07_04065 [Candidatus Doudnabacteria bacterium RIFCSPLOWO2_02_FULL_49_13]|uniref:Uncharacterized protein n=1 Tax=Candidatus Doudnabacteria bacterium RIFCSPHIGHO2_12_FULL_48_16 TaxID=1817838 RepID=A0A1F5PJM9_9BACT|nr:MAG: hypothetical protein A3B77_02870 [Candidatus Doudnabacteria bacterium RIFCSPHIGHO2_02_FULL_49_24]OGE89228.1 MAG: hypothetical protein A2760_04450 [Candidatus Doudnabacteria bacterium RIFCSPHIGHO2_01_FULL_50_67]OGE90091.1 MAG: hypothetical protein A3E29_03205 [Candidatus Doudnabacteria bacterium RIFCSPHIGHO2_12_FULL_48_16]OGE97122.1 MAG: hypothetical protein A2990_00915 [Candidatus Doudnabacteria bacterium RIFCSPLOWO2_01_FULL_49_40]OGF03235.1 MAG: hypothetical protein A3J07_04065 [Candid
MTLFREALRLLEVEAGFLARGTRALAEMRQGGELLELIFDATTSPFKYGLELLGRLLTASDELSSDEQLETVALARKLQADYPDIPKILEVTSGIIAKHG